MLWGRFGDNKDGPRKYPKRRGQMSEVVQPGRGGAMRPGQHDPPNMFPKLVLIQNGLPVTLMPFDRSPFQQSGYPED